MNLIVVPGVLCVTGAQGQNDWGVTYTSTQICAFKGSTVDMHCNYTYPRRLANRDTKVTERYWFTKMKGNRKGFVKLTTDSEYSGRVEYICKNNSCTLRTTNLRESDSTVYKFRFITNQPRGKYTGKPGITLSVTGNVMVY